MTIALPSASTTRLSTAAGVSVRALPPGLPDEPRIDYAASTSVRPVGRFVWRPVEVAALPADPSPLLAGRRVVIIGGSDTTADQVAAELRTAGAMPFRLPTAGEGDAADLVADLHAVISSDATGRGAGHAQLDGIIDLNLDRPLDATGTDGWGPGFDQTVAVLQSVYPEWVVETDAVRLFYLAVTRMGGRMGFVDDVVPQPLGGLWAGLAKGLPRELPNCNIRVLDVAEQDRDDLAKLVCRELYRWGDFEIGYHASRRYTLVAEPAAVSPPTRSLHPGDVVVMSGGGRGIGFALARALAANFGCRVVVSGRAPAPDLDSDVHRMSDAEFRTYRDGRLAEAARERRLPQVRAELNRQLRTRELAANLQSASRDGLDIGYCQADVARREDVDRLMAAAGPKIAGVVHDAGVDHPIRLPGKTAADVRAVVSVKVDGFFNLVSALRGRPKPAFFCSVGSLTGRWGGMTGQLDYGAANEALSRVSLWAAHRTDQPLRDEALPVTTVCWPTWDRLGMITNYDATLQYMSAVDIDAGLYHWQRELLAEETGERTFIGEVGPAMLPTVLRGYRQDAGLPQIERLVSSRFLLGEPVRFQPYQSIVSDSLLEMGELPCCADFRVSGVPAVPASLCLELLRSAGDWVQPERPAALTLTTMESVEIDLGGLRFDGPDVLRVRKEAAGSWDADGRWRVDATLSVVDPDGSARQVGAAVLRYASRPQTVDGGRAERPSRTTAVPTDGLAGALDWRGQVIRLAGWRRDDESGSWYAAVDPDRIDDLVTATPTPQFGLPLNQVENVVRAISLSQLDRLGPDPAGVLTVHRIEVGTGVGAPAGWASGAPDGRTWTCVASDGAPQLMFHQPDFRRRAAQPPAPKTDDPSTEGS
ncbi:MAG TPA: KR domain-containing protein [Propionibacteriaceae bacterium]|nr:KR domain-containing protein [Propionibacteriaceae bacterium]